MRVTSLGVIVRILSHERRLVLLLVLVALARLPKVPQGLSGEIAQGARKAAQEARVVREGALVEAAPGASVKARRGRRG